jgi:hypothetical protein
MKNERRRETVAVLFLHSSFILLHLLLVATVPPRCAERLAAIGNGENFSLVDYSSWRDYRET